MTNQYRPLSSEEVEALVIDIREKILSTRESYHDCDVQEIGAFNRIKGRAQGLENALASVLRIAKEKS